MADLSLVTFEIETVSGVTGLGYSLNINRGSGAKPVEAALEHVVAPALVGQEIDHPELVWERLGARVSRLGAGGVAGLALSAADVAVWDAHAIARDEPLYRLLGARRDRVPAYASSFDRLYPDEDFLETVEEYLASGLSAVKIRLGHPKLNDRHRLSILRELIGPDVTVMADANSNWDLPTALRKLPMLEEFDLAFLEEPVAPEDAEGFAEVQRHTSIPIAGGENLYTIAEHLRFFQAKAIRVPQPDLGRAGGVTGWLRIARLAEAFGLPISSHLMQEVAVHVLCAVGNPGWLEYVPTFAPIFAAPLEIDPDGMATPPSTPGTGVRFQPELIERCRI